MDATRFDRAFEIVVGHEGGFTNSAADPGNWTGGRIGVGHLVGTKFGISAGSYPNEDIRNLTLDQAKAIYLRDYWSKIRGDDLPSSLSLLVFDAAVNNGVNRASLWLQEVAGAYQDGIIGPVTIAAVRKTTMHTGKLICSEFLATRVHFMSSLATWPTFGRGWSRRLCRIAFQSAEFT